MWTIIEWTGTILALSGAVIMATKRFSHAIAWIFWILSNVFFIALFVLETKQFGLLFAQLAGLVINTLGFWQWHNKKESNKILATMLYASSLIALTVALFTTGKFIMGPELKYVEWTGSLLSISAALLISAYHKHSKYCWILWLVANFLILILTFYTKQYGVMALQAGFSITNILGTWNWLIKPMLNKDNKSIDNSELAAANQ